MAKFVLWLNLFLLVSNSFAQSSKIQKKDVEGAAKIFDLNFTSTEIDTLLSDVQDNLSVYQKQHQVHLPNSVPLSLWQTVLIPGVSVNKNQHPIAWTKVPGTELPSKKSSLAFYSIPQLAELIKTKKISSVQLTQFYIDRIKKYGDTLQCLISLTESIALEQAKQADEEISHGKYRGMLHGIPYGLKDLFAVKGTKTTWGAAPYKEQVIEEDAFVYQQLRQAGAVLVAKFTLGALAMGDYWYGGRTKNPWNLALGSSGSSAGSASATVAGLVPFAIGTETWGSIVSPSTACGALGLRPTFGRVSRTGAMALSYSLDKIGPICRNAEDAAIVFNAIRGTDGLDLSANEAAFNYSNQVDVKKLRIGYAKNYFDKLKDTTANEWQVLKVLQQAGAKIVPLEFSENQFYPFQMMDVIISAECAAQFDELTRFNVDDELTMQRKGDWPNQFRTARFIPAVEYINAQRHRYLLMQQVNYLFKDFDVIICPSLYSGNQLAITNLTGHPVVCIPNGFDKKTKKPTSISFLGNLFDEATILALAKIYQDATPWDEMHPELFK
ncbi:amidase [Aquirufa ecclesiirivi]|uniref:Amidase n=1 Tax=Aquirufa ecclesiirivi TaxID=2715124 RepID=A0ABT4JFW7_9BACT|nr:amidase [Aquirufa ecclesiirivi]MCZ2473018.1 amidase [Aquirufa ecclesiirivi]MCZ2474803.1 amidase [Aquirufa ecclesiirivi]MDF0692813.1 amidase [Aquirufa ecclesiirivi]NHC47834.1 amidase [Aquirufa ecclesiirivi]